jgi:glutathione S-transferase
MDSRPIAEAIEAAHPTPSLRLAASAAVRARMAHVGWLAPLRAVWMPRVPRALLGPRSQDFFVRTREARLGMTLAEYEADEAQAEEAWGKTKPGLLELARLLGETDGPFFLGHEREFCAYSA